MPKDYIPSREAELVTWSNNFSTLITASPITYGLTAPQAVSLAGYQSAFVDAYQTASDPATRSPSNIIAKNSAMDSLKNYARELARIVQATPTMTDQQKSDLGLTVRDVGPSPIHPPGDAPRLDIVSAAGRRVKARLHDITNPSRRGKPAGVAGASVFSSVGAAPPAAISDWTFEGNTSRTSFDVEFPAEVPAGSTVWLTAFWFNPRAQNGPTCPPVSTNLPGGSAVAA